MILFHVDFPTVMILELLRTELTVISGGQVWMRRLYVNPHVVHIPTSLSTQQTNDTTAINILLAVRLHVVVSVLPGSGHFCRLEIPIGFPLYLCVEGQGVDNLGKS